VQSIHLARTVPDVRIAFYLYTVLAAAGIYVSELLIKVHLETRYAKAADSGLCAGDGFSCADAANSEYAELFGLPIAALGMAFYVAVLVMAGVARFKASMTERLADVFLLGGLLSVGYSIFLGVVSVTDIGKACPLCLSLYGINLGLFLVAGFTHPAKWGGLKSMFGGLASSAFGATVAVLVVATIAVQGMYAHRAEGAVKAAERMKQVADLRKPAKLDVDPGDAPGKGPADAPLVVVEFSDMQCPHCKRLAESLDATAKAMNGKLRYHFKHFPMDPKCNRIVQGSGHPHACDAAVAVVCADRMGKAWPMHDLIFQNQRSMGRDIFVGYAQQIGVDVEAFSACIDDDAAMDVVKADIEQGIKLGVPGTPVWFVNGWRNVGARDPAALQAIFEQRLAADRAPQ